MSGFRILAVDDSLEVLALTVKILKNQDYEVIQAEDGPQALSVCEAAKGQIDLLLTDVNMPGMTGMELAERIRASYPSVRVLLISGYCAEENIKSYISQNGFGFVAKPFLPQALINAVKDSLAGVKRGPYSSGIVPGRRSTKRA